MSYYKTWFVRIDNWQPTRLNQLLNCQWRKNARLKKTDAAIIAVSILGADVPRAEIKRRVSVEIILGPRQRAADPDAYWKSLLDGLVVCGALVDDSRTWCELGSVSFQRGKRRARILKLENIYTFHSAKSIETMRAKKVRHHLNFGRRERLSQSDSASYLDDKCL